MKVANRVLALVLALAVIAAAVILIIEVIAFRVGAGTVVVNWHRIYNWAGDTAWTAASVRVICGLLVLLGLAVIFTQLKRRRPERLETTSADPATDTAITRQGVTESVRNAVGGIDGVSGVGVKLRRRLTVVARTRANQPSADAVAETARSTLDGLRLRRPPRLTVRTTSQER